MASGSASRRPPAPAYRDLSSLRDTLDAQAPTGAPASSGKDRQLRVSTSLQAATVSVEREEVESPSSAALQLSCSISYAYCEKERRNEDQCHYTESSRNQAVLTDLRRATQYEVQVRARTKAGYGSFSPAAIFRTLPDGHDSSQFLVPGILISVGMLLLVTFVFVAAYCLRRHSRIKDPELSR
ncbi:ephrin type-B receptor 4 [Lates japonicus]|uniref:Ephrin type-B receptor 4 n=1 Tax=Lates japonicus TaxID=270547 RepID=A0AAD3QVZ0_LATJO|nr:ephrin type-B receptor 4 [Lates japonicus]